MINVNELIDDQLICENFGCPKHIFDDGELTFADIRDIFTKIFSGGLTIHEHPAGIKLMITYKDGEFKIAKKEKELKDPFSFSKANAKMYDLESELSQAFDSSIKDLTQALSELDDVQLNRFFANGQNYLVCQIVCPPVDRLNDYKNKCFIVLEKIVCYNDQFKEVGEDTESTKQLLNMLNDNDALQQGNSEITHPNVLRIKNLKSCKKILEEILSKLDEFIDGVGWKCSLNGYVQDRYGRHIINKAREHGVDVARNSSFVNELASRLSNISGRKPTKSDLITFAKREGVDYKSQGYKDLINDLESNCEQTNTEIVKPIENLIANAAFMLMKNIAGYMYVDPSSAASKAIANIDDGLMEYTEDDINAMTPEMMQRFKKSLAKIESYYEAMPKSSAMIKYKGKIYNLTPSFGDPNDILSIIRYK